MRRPLPRKLDLFAVDFEDPAKEMALHQPVPLPCDPPPVQTVQAPQPQIIMQPQQTVIVNQPRPSGGHDAATCILAFLASCFIPGLGQLIKGQPVAAVLWFIFVCVGYLAILPGLVLHFICVIDAAIPRRC